MQEDAVEIAKEFAAGGVEGGVLRNRIVCRDFFL